MQKRQRFFGWLAKTSKLSLSDAKTRIRHTKKGGFHFLGWQFSHLKRSGTYYTCIVPRKKARKQILLRVREIIKNHRASSAYVLIEALKPVLIGWCNYHKHVQSSDAFSNLDHEVFCKLRPWVFRRGRSPGRKELKNKYFPSGMQYTYDGKVYFANWNPVGKEKGEKGKNKTNFLPRAACIRRLPYTKVKEAKSPFDGDHAYWAKRLKT